MKSLKLFWLIITLSVTVGCAKTPEDAQQKQVNGADNTTVVAEDPYVDERDPFESVNRELWDFNWNVLDKYVLRPLAVGYSEYLPQPAQTGVRNFVTNLEEPGYALNHLLQGKFLDSGAAVGRFAINSTVGLFGLIDVADYLGLEQKKESFGETMAVAGVGNGPYIMVPAYGPTTARDATGDFVDGQIFPLYLLDWPLALFKTGVKAIYTRADLIQQESMINSSTDSYVFIKEVYYQNQNFKIHDGNPPLEEEEEIDEEFLDEID